MSAEGVALIPTCQECQAAWLPADDERWRAYLGCDENVDEVAESSSTGRRVPSGSSRTRCPGPGQSWMTHSDRL